MGTDITAHIEYKEPRKAEATDYYDWFGAVYLPRSYSMFQVLAGVRMAPDYENRALIVLVEPRGFPDNAASGTRDGDCYSGYESGAGWHTPSYLTAAEFRQAIKRFEDLFAVPPNALPEYRAALAAMEQLPDARIVFWFDG